LGDVVPADLRLLETTRLQCDEAVLTGESMPVEKSDAEVAPRGSPLDLPSCALMGTVVHQGGGLGVVVSTGAATAFGQIAVGLAAGAGAQARAGEAPGDDRGPRER